MNLDALTLKSYFKIALKHTLQNELSFAKSTDKLTYLFINITFIDTTKKVIKNKFYGKVYFSLKIQKITSNNYTQDSLSESKPLKKLIKGSLDTISSINQTPKSHPDEYLEYHIPCLILKVKGIDSDLNNLYSHTIYIVQNQYSYRHEILSIFKELDFIKDGIDKKNKEPIYFNSSLKFKHIIYLKLEETPIPFRQLEP